jgi:hypothetical protein
MESSSFSTGVNVTKIRSGFFPDIEGGDPISTEAVSTGALGDWHETANIDMMMRI